jgi:hypothetical protein
MLYKQYSGSLLFKRYQMLVKYSNLNQTKLKEGGGQERVGIKCFKPGLVDKPVFLRLFCQKMLIIGSAAYDLAFAKRF